MTQANAQAAELAAAHHAPAGQQAGLQVSRVNLVYPGGIEALRSVSLSARLGEFVAVAGPSGCGKSRLLKLIIGLERSTSGDIFVSGRRVTAPHRDVGAVFQSPVLLP